MLEGICRAGEIVWVPSGWWHLVLCTEDSVAITQNYASRATLPSVLRFLRDRPYAVSGVQPGSAASLHARFVEALRAHRPGVLEGALGDLAGDPGKEDCAAKVDAETATAPPEPPAEAAAVAHGSEAPRVSWTALLRGGVSREAAAEGGEANSGASLEASHAGFTFGFAVE